MSEAMLTTYSWAAAAVIAMLTMYVVQIIVGDLAQDAKGHTPGKVYEGDHDDFTFRAIRAPLNSLENMPFMILLILMGVALSAAPIWLNLLAISCALVRFAHMLAFWAGIRPIRQASWMFGVLAMILLSGLDLWTLFANAKFPALL
jgi:uncharacterized MAPEG superfamily protein